MVGPRWGNDVPGGISSVVSTYATYIENLNYIVTAGSRDDNKLKKIYLCFVGYIKFLFQLLFNKKIKIIHIQGSHGASYYRKSKFVKLAKIFDKKVIWHMHASQFVPFYKNSTSKVDIQKNINSTDILIVLSNYYADFYKKIGVNPNKVRILNNIVPEPFKVQQKNSNDNLLHILFLGEISERKGAFDIVKTIGANRDLADKVEIRIGGNGETAKLKQMIHNAHLDDCIKFEGWVSGHKKDELLEWADIYILPSFNEGLPISILEALSYRCPIISTPVGGIPEVVITEKTNNINGILVEPGNTTEIADAISYYTKFPEKIKEHGDVSIKIVSKFYPNAVFAQLKDIYYSLL